MYFERANISTEMKLVLLLVFALSACTAQTDIPLEYPTPPPAIAATPLPKLEQKRDVALEKQFAEIAKDARGKVGVAAVVLETGEAALLNADDHYPMQSVYKLPISMAVVDQVRLGRLDLDEKIGVTKDDLVRIGQASPLRDKNPNGGEFTIRELIRLALVESDGTASDVLMRIAGGPTAVQDYLTQIGIRDMKIVNTEKEFALDWKTQYENWATPLAAVELLRFVEARPKTEDDDDDPIIAFMIGAVTGPARIKGSLPAGTQVAHKTGTSGSRSGITAATNDIGIVYLPNGKHLAMAVFVSDSPANDKTREAIIAHIAKAAWDRWGI
jgi:beta-lactamase class A